MSIMNLITEKASSLQPRPFDYADDWVFFYLAVAQLGGSGDYGVPCREVFNLMQLDYKTDQFMLTKLSFEKFTKLFCYGNSSIKEELRYLTHMPVLTLCFNSMF